MTSTDASALEGVLLRPARPEDAESVAAVHLASRKAAVPAMPPPAHTDAEVLDHVGDRVRGGQDEVWVAEADGAVRAYLRLSPTWMDDLYVAPGWTGRGLGTALLGLAKSLRPQGFGLWVFESNLGARRLYAREGLLELEHTDGSGNEERSPDVRMVWPGSDPVVFLRGQVDEVDDELADLLARRTALTAAIQRVKPVGGPAGRDPAREEAIVRRIAARAPALGEAHVRRIMHEVIAVGLDLAGGAADPSR